MICKLVNAYPEDVDDVFFQILGWVTGLYGVISQEINKRDGAGLNMRL
jgi:hypothetical protein